ncbi:hypothetical protein ACQCLI_31940 (plasmid) [Pseudomonas nitroreducens]|uniref:hypothetical protein n=2 Tax=Pseudomonas TaxID=286 RepID=UPI00190F7DF0|nr:hypothetical protein [Pseudomonas nitroreducens]MBF3053145.1 hypothetical protein [Pseudomonas aeruginosa]
MSMAEIFNRAASMPQTTAILAPEVGAIVHYGTNSFGTEPGRYRVSGYMRRVEKKPDFGNDFIAEILFDSCRERDGTRLQWCVRADATHLSLTGIAGAIAPIEQCEVVGMVAWSEAELLEARQFAQLLGESGELLF